MLESCFYWDVKSERHNEILKAFGVHLKNLREEKGLTQEDLAYTADISISQISRIERGIISSSLSQMISIADTLKITLSELVSF